MFVITIPALRRPMKRGSFLVCKQDSRSLAGSIAELRSVARRMSWSSNVSANRYCEHYELDIRCLCFMRLTRNSNSSM